MSVPTLLDSKRINLLQAYCFASLRLSPGEFWECGVYKGGSALAIASAIAQCGQQLRLFDTFKGHPEDDIPGFAHRKGGFSDTSFRTVQDLFADMEGISFHVGMIPTTFAGLENSTIRFAHIDVDLYQSTKAAIEFIFPRLVPGGVIVDDDYFAKECGARQAVDEYLSTLSTGSHYTHKGFHPQLCIIKE